MFKRLIKVGFKASILTSAVYYTIDQGLWEDTESADKIYSDIYQAAAPYFKEVPVEVPELPSVSGLAALIKFYYNQGIISTGNFLKDLPSNAASVAEELQSTLSTMLEAPPSQENVADNNSGKS
ncbi:MICOS complex subunit MIC13-like protein QIL1 [Frankliniella fusca]|uniref:MICOS complex subunit MIC13 n=1 Tax=Frankliniella fusca TaxID=407009 RepID=A0AAE1I085_9NEOP|nr:MICOS complex subunit MIC13-like protein QIL1 [Frankliniella fusca]